MSIQATISKNYFKKLRKLKEGEGKLGEELEKVEMMQIVHLYRNFQKEHLKDNTIKHYFIFLYNWLCSGSHVI